MYGSTIAPAVELRGSRLLLRRKLLFYKSTRSRQSMLCAYDSDKDAVIPHTSRVMSYNMLCSYRAQNGFCVMLQHTARSSF